MRRERAKSAKEDTKGECGMGILPMLGGQKSRGVVHGFSTFALLARAGCPCHNARSYFPSFVFTVTENVTFPAGGNSRIWPAVLSGDLKVFWTCAGLNSPLSAVIVMPCSSVAVK